MQDVVGHITEGVCRPLKVSNQITLLLFFKLLNAYCSLSCSAHIFYGSGPQVRIEQVIVAEPGAVLLYKLSNLLKFYHHTIRYLI